MTSTTQSILLICGLLAGCGRNSPTPPPAPAPEWFADITEQTGIRFTHAAGTNYFMPDQVGSGVALFDYDNDGRLDVYLVQNGGTNSGARSTFATCSVIVSELERPSEAVNWIPV